MKGIDKVYEFLKKCGTYYLATADGNQPRVRPFGTIDLFGGKLYIQTGKSKEVSRQMKQNPRIEICALSGESWLRIAADAVEDDDRDARVHMLDAYPSLKALYAPDDGNTQVFYLKNVEATFSSFAAAPETYRF